MQWSLLTDGAGVLRPWSEGTRCGGACSRGCRNGSIGERTVAVLGGREHEWSGPRRPLADAAVFVRLG